MADSYPFTPQIPSPIPENNNQKHPNTTFQAVYPYNKVTITRGGHEFHENSTPGNESIRRGHTTGTYEEIGYTGRKVSAVVGKNFDYHADGSSKTVDGHSDEKVAGTHRQNVDGSKSHETTGNHYSGSGGIGIHGSQDSTIHASAGGDAFHTSQGDKVAYHDGNIHDSTTGDHVTHISGNKADIIVGDHAENIQNGSKDIQINNGNLRIKCKDFSIECDTFTLITTLGPIMIQANNNLGVVTIQSGSKTVLPGNTIYIQGGIGAVPKVVINPIGSDVIFN